MKTCAALICMFVFVTFCRAQDSSTSTADQDAKQTVAAAAAESRQRVKDEAVKKADIRHLVEITGAANLAVQTMEEMEKNMRPLVAGALPPGEYRDKLVDLFFEKLKSKRDPEQLLAMIIPIYDKYYSDDEIKELIEMYESPIGQKMVSLLPKIAADLQATGKTWGEQMGRQSMLEVLAEHPELQTALQNAYKNVRQH